MNIVLKSSTNKRPEFFIACIKKNGTYHVYGKYVSFDGVLRIVSKSESFPTEAQARLRCRSLAKSKIRKKGFIEIGLGEIPKRVVPFLEIPPDMQLTAEEMILMIQKTRRERYVVFKDVNGIEESFDVGIEYLAEITDDEGVLTVYDRFGEARQCFVERMSAIVPTDEARQAEGFKKL